MSSLTSDEHRALDAAREFAARHVEPNVRAWERGELHSRAVLPEAALAGLLSLEVPRSEGGQGFSFGCKWRVAEVLAAADFGFAMSLINTQNVANQLAREAPREVANRYVPALLTGKRTACTALTEPSAGSDFSAITTLARQVGTEWVMEGHKAWIVNAAHADVVVVYAQTDPAMGSRGIAAFIVDGTREGFIRQAGSDTRAAMAVEAGGFVLQSYRAQSNEMLYAPGQAFKVALASINGARVYVAAMCCGMVAECLRLANDYGAKRHTFGSPLQGHQGWRWILADTAIELEAARLLVKAAAARIDGGVDAQVAAAHAKVFATRMAGRHIAALMHAMGAEGLREQHPFLRHLAAAQVATLVDGSTEMLLERVARDVCNG